MSDAWREQLEQAQREVRERFPAVARLPPRDQILATVEAVRRLGATVRQLREENARLLSENARLREECASCGRAGTAVPQVTIQATESVPPTP